MSKNSAIIRNIFLNYLANEADSSLRLSVVLEMDLASQMMQTEVQLIASLTALRGRQIKCKTTIIIVFSLVKFSYSITAHQFAPCYSFECTGVHGTQLQYKYRTYYNSCSTFSG